MDTMATRLVSFGHLILLALSTNGWWQASIAPTLTHGHPVTSLLTMDICMSSKARALPTLSLNSRVAPLIPGEVSSSRALYPPIGLCRTTSTILTSVIIGSGFAKCTELIGSEFERVFYKNDFSFGVKIFNLYMTYGGTNWGMFYKL